MNPQRFIPSGRKSVLFQIFPLWQILPSFSLTFITDVICSQLQQHRWVCQSFIETLSFWVLQGLKGSCKLQISPITSNWVKCPFVHILTYPLSVRAFYYLLSCSCSGAHIDGEKWQYAQARRPMRFRRQTEDQHLNRQQQEPWNNLVCWKVSREENLCV